MFVERGSRPRVAWLAGGIDGNRVGANRNRPGSSKPKRASSPPGAQCSI